MSIIQAFRNSGLLLVFIRLKLVILWHFQTATVAQKLLYHGLVMDKTLATYDISTLTEIANKKPPFKKTDFRYEKWVRSRKALKQKVRQNKFKVEFKHERVGPNTITVDTSKARASLDLVRLCMKKLHWKEVILKDVEI